MNKETDSSSQPSAILGEIVWLYSHSPIHADWPITSIHQWILPALYHNQFRLYRRAGRATGYVSWAWLTQEIETNYVLDSSSLRSEAWKSGDRGWIIDLVVPFGDLKSVVHDLKHNLFVNDVGRSLRQRPGSDTMHINYLHGAKALDKAKDRILSPTVELEKT